MDLIIGAWFHPSGLERTVDSGFDLASRAGFTSARTYTCQHSERIAGELRKCGMSLYGGVAVSSGSFQLTLEKLRPYLYDTFIVTDWIGIKTVKLPPFFLDTWKFL